MCFSSSAIVDGANEEELGPSLPLPIYLFTDKRREKAEAILQGKKHIAASGHYLREYIAVPSEGILWNSLEPTKIAKYYLIKKKSM